MDIDADCRIHVCILEKVVPMMEQAEWTDMRYMNVVNPDWVVACFEKVAIC